MEITGIDYHPEGVTVTTGSLRVQVRPYRDEHGRLFDEVVVSSLGGQEAMEEIRGRQTRIARVPLPEGAER
jgi:hypothetical protein